MRHPHLSRHDREDGSSYPFLIFSGRHAGVLLKELGEGEGVAVAHGIGGVGHGEILLSKQLHGFLDPDLL